MPVISNATRLLVGVYAGDLKTTTPAEVPCLISILCTDVEATDGKVKEYRDEARRAADEAKRAAEVLVSPTISVTEITGGHRVTITDIDGAESFDVMDAVSEEQQTQLNTLWSKYLEENYTGQMTGTFSATRSGGTFDIGDTIKSTFTWSFSKLPTSLTVGGNTIAEPTQTGTTDEKIFTANSQTSRSFTIRGVYKGPYGDESASQTWTYYFQNKRYWGMAEAPTDKNGEFVTPGGDFIKKLKAGATNGEYATSYKKSFNLKDSSSDKYIWYAYPKRFGAATFTMGGFAGGFTTPYTVSVTNSKGFTEDYYLYRSAEKGVGTLDIVVK